MTDPTPPAPSEAEVGAAARELYERVKKVSTLTYDIAYPSEQADFRRVATNMLAAAYAIRDAALEAKLAAAEAERDRMLKIAAAALGGKP